MKVLVSFLLAAAAASLNSASAISIPPISKDETAKLMEGPKDGPLQFAVPHEVTITPDKDGEWDPESKTWTLQVDSKGAKNLNFGFVEFQLPEDAKISIAMPGDKDGKPTWAGTSKDNKESHEYWTRVFPTDEVTIKLTYRTKEPMPNAPDGSVLTIGSINVGFRDFGVGEKSGSCNVDVVCPDGIGWELEIRSVAVYSKGGSLACTGAMINNVEEDATPFFLTADHCTVTPGNVGSVVTYWNYETSTCGGPPDGTLDQFLSGASFLTDLSANDMTLILLDDDPPQEWGVTFAGWTSDPNGYQTLPGVAIHHPSVDEKRISFEFDAMATTSYGGNSVSPSGTHVKVYDWDSGTTEPGSSGSPLFNGDHRIIGQLHGGSAACGNNAPDWYGRFSQSYPNGGMAQYLDPNNVFESGTAFTDSYDPYAFPTISPAPTATPTTSPPTGSPTPCTGSDVIVYLLTDNYASETSWEITDDSGSVVLSGAGYSNGNTYIIEECLPAGGCFTFTIFDSYGDGICCGYGQGQYAVVFEGEVVGTGGDFNSVETVDFGDEGSSFSIVFGGSTYNPPCSFLSPNNVAQACTFAGATAATDCPCTCADYI